LTHTDARVSVGLNDMLLIKNMVASRKVSLVLSAELTVSTIVKTKSLVKFPEGVPFYFVIIFVIVEREGQFRGPVSLLQILLKKFLKMMRNEAL
jgi:hypothetical protein